MNLIHSSTQDNTLLNRGSYAVCGSIDSGRRHYQTKSIMGCSKVQSRVRGCLVTRRRDRGEMMCGGITVICTERAAGRVSDQVR